MVKLFFSLVFVLPLLGRLLPVVNTLVQTIYMQYLSSFAGLHTVWLFLLSRSFMIVCILYLCLFLL